MKLSTYTLLISATTAVQMRTMQEEPQKDPPMEPADTMSLECVFDAKAKKCIAKEIQGDQENTCLEYKDEKTCLGANEPKGTEVGGEGVVEPDNGEFEPETMPVPMEGGAETMPEMEGGPETMPEMEGGPETMPVPMEGGPETMPEMEGGDETVEPKEPKEGGNAIGTQPIEGGPETMPEMEGGPETMPEMEGGDETIQPKEPKEGGNAIGTEPIEGGNEIMPEPKEGRDAIGTEPETDDTVEPEIPVIESIGCEGMNDDAMTNGEDETTDIPEEIEVAPGAEQPTSDGVVVPEERM